MAYQEILLDIAGGVATITLNRPDRLNALTTTMLDEIGDALDRAVEAGARAILLTGAGRAFCSGANLTGSGGELALPDDLGALLEDHYNPLARKIAALQVPVVSAVQGAAAGAGLSLALSADIVVAAKSSYLLLAFANIGLVPDAGATWLVAKSAGRMKALEMALLGEKLPADEALAAGLLTRVVADDALPDETRRIAAKLAAMPTIALGLIRSQVREALDGTYDRSLDLERDHQRRAGRSRDFAEGVQAFIAKRPAHFEGR